MNEVEILERDLHERFPRAVLTVDSPSSRAGVWYVDLRHGKQSLTIQWSSDRGFGLSTVASEYGEGPEEVFWKRDQIEDRVVELLDSDPDASEHMPHRDSIARRI